MGKFESCMACGLISYWKKYFPLKNGNRKKESFLYLVYKFIKASFKHTSNECMTSTGKCFIIVIKILAFFLFAWKKNELKKRSNILNEKLHHTWITNVWLLALEYEWAQFLTGYESERFISLWCYIFLGSLLWCSVVRNILSFWRKCNAFHLVHWFRF